jgi:hypothetical protein
MPVASPEQTDTKTHHPRTKFFVIVIVVLAAIISTKRICPPQRTASGPSRPIARTSMNAIQSTATDCFRPW